MFRKITKRHWTILIVSILIIAFIIFVVPVALPLILALLTALALNPLVHFFANKTRLKRSTSAILVFLMSMIILIVFGTLIVTSTISQVAHFVDGVPEYINRLNILYLNVEQNFYQYSKGLPSDLVLQITNSFEENLTNLSNFINEKITLDNVAKLFAKIPELLISLVVYLIALFLFMLELPQLQATFYNLLTEETERKVRFMNKRLSSVFFGFFKAQFLLSLLIFGASLIGLFIIMPEVAFVMALVIGLIDFIPIIGSIIILGPWAIFMFLSGDTVLGTKLAILAIILLALRRIMEPKLMGKHIGLSPLATLIAMFLGLKLLGIFGFILGPLLVIAYTSARDAGIITWNPKI